MPAETHTQHVPRDRGDLAKQVVERLAELLDTEPSELVAGRLASELQIDAVVLFELFEVLEEELGERTLGSPVADEEFDELRTVGDIVEFAVARFS